MHYFRMRLCHWLYVGFFIDTVIHHLYQEKGCLCSCFGIMSVLSCTFLVTVYVCAPCLLVPTYFALCTCLSHHMCLDVCVHLSHYHANDYVCFYARRLAPNADQLVMHLMWIFDAKFTRMESHKFYQFSCFFQASG